MMTDWHFILRRLPLEVSMVAVRSRGPGGQNVNKVSSACQLYWDIQSSTALNEAQKDAVRDKLDSFINKTGQLYLRSDEFRDLEQNRRRCLEKLEALLRRALFKPKPRKKTKPTRAAKERRHQQKARRSETKTLRRRL
jgi:ribosome-associated protein